MTARREGRDFPCGLFCYRIEDDLKLGRLLIAEHFVAIDLLDPGAVLAALVQELDMLAKRLGCHAVRSLVNGGTSEVEDGLYAAGHRPEGATLLLKNLPEASRCDDLAFGDQALMQPAATERTGGLAAPNRSNRSGHRDP